MCYVNGSQMSSIKIANNNNDDVDEDVPTTTPAAPTAHSHTHTHIGKWAPMRMDDDKTVDDGLFRSMAINK